MKFRSKLIPLGMLLLVSFGCHRPGSPVDEDARQDALALLMPNKIEIVKPFTRVRSFDDDTTPDGIELLLRAVNALDNPGLMIVGDVRVELYEYTPASSDHKGRQFDRWEIELRTEDEQRTYWNQLTQMYEFKLQINPDEVPRAEKYVLQVTYTSPLGEYLTDDYVLGYRNRVGPLGGPRG